MDMPSKELWVGVDWADEEHQVCIVDADGELVESFAVPHRADALKDMGRRLRASGRVAGVAIETPRHLIVYQLLAEGFVVYPINPETSHKWCKALSPAGATTDPDQAYALADGLSHHHARLRPLLPDEAQSRELALLCEAEVDLIRQRTAFVNELQHRLKDYFPAAMECFDDWTSPSAWDFVAALPTPQALADAPERKLYAFLKNHHIGAGPRWQDRIARRKEATTWPSDPAMLAVSPWRVQALVALLRTLETQLKSFRRRIEALFAQHPDAQLFASLPGAGPKLAPRLAAHFGSQRGRYESARSVQQLAGCVPVTTKSGKSKKVYCRRACQKPFRNTLHQFAFASLKDSQWARASYDMARDRGQSHARALRTVGAKWVKVVYRMWVSRTPYNEAVYLASLIRHHSPIIQWMQSHENQEKPSRKT